MPARRPKEIREYYDRLSNSYGTLYGQEQAMKHDKALGKIGGRMYNVIVDIGCGDGMLLSKLYGHSTLRVGLDFSAGMLERAKDVLGENGNLVRGDACHLPFRDGVADCVLSISLSDRESIAALVSEAFRIARDDATLLVSTIHPHDSPPSKFPGLTLLDQTRLSARETLYLLSKTGRPMLKNEWKRMIEGR